MNFVKGENWFCLSWWNGLNKVHGSSLHMTYSSPRKTVNLSDFCTYGVSSLFCQASVMSWVLGYLCFDCRPPHTTWREQYVYLIIATCFGVSVYSCRYHCHGIFVFIYVLIYLFYFWLYVCRYLFVFLFIYTALLFKYFIYNFFY